MHAGDFSQISSRPGQHAYWEMFRHIQKPEQTLDSIPPREADYAAVARGLDFGSHGGVEAKVRVEVV